MSHGGPHEVFSLSNDGYQELSEAVWWKANAGSAAAIVSIAAMECGPVVWAALPAAEDAAAVAVLAVWAAAPATSPTPTGLDCAATASVIHLAARRPRETRLPREKREAIKSNNPFKSLGNHVHGCAIRTADRVSKRSL